MASPEFLDTAKKVLEEVGYLVLDDMKVGEYMREIEQKGSATCHSFHLLVVSITSNASSAIR
jgi:hypothetical protein